MIDAPSITEELAQAERRRLLGNLHFHRTEAKAAKRALDQLERDCARVGIRLVREPIQTRQGESHATRDPDPR